MGDKGLKVDESREILEVANNSGVGDRPPSLVVGPLDLATSNAADALLKTIEEISTKPLRLVLWADHLKEVIPTIRSRTLAVWCPPGKFSLDFLTPEAREEGRSLAKAVRSGDPLRILASFESPTPWVDLLQVLIQELATFEKAEELEASLQVWENLRPLLRGGGSKIIPIDALLPRQL